MTKAITVAVAALLIAFAHSAYAQHALGQLVPYEPSTPAPKLIGVIEILKGKMSDFKYVKNISSLKGPDILCTAKMLVKVPMGPYTRNFFVRRGDRLEVSEVVCDVLKQAQTEKKLLTAAGKCETANGKQGFSVYTVSESLE
ncbi:MAG: hypothetical protein ABH871_10060 [Pseudomonadota bacterium]